MATAKVPTQKEYYTKLSKIKKPVMVFLISDMGNFRARIISPDGMCKYNTYGCTSGEFKTSCFYSNGTLKQTLKEMKEYDKDYSREILGIIQLK